jgi:outer membrane protein OmpA-like peptidoglycan-associated protein
MASNRTLRAGAGTILALAGIATSVTLALPMAASASAGTAWFHDPVSAKARHAEIAVPASPDSYTGPLRHTTATFRTHRGSIAVPVARAYGHTLVRGQALSLSKASLFAFNSPIPTHAAKAEIRRLGGALADVRRVTCEGYTDFGGLASHESTLSRQRAKAICALVHRHHGITTTSVGYGGTRPVIVGGTASNRAQNRRVIIDITSSSTTPPKPVAPSAPHLSTATAGDGTATITFTKPAKTGGKAVTGYQVSTDGGKAWTAVTTSGSSPSPSPSPGSRTARPIPSRSAPSTPWVTGHRATPST